MPKFSLTVGLVLYGVGLVVITLLNVFSAAPSANKPGFGYQLTDSFSQTSLNNRVLYAPAFRLVPGESLTRLNRRIRQTFRQNRNRHMVTFGHTSDVPEGWVYLLLTNTTKTAKETVLSLPQHRCSRATLFLQRAGPPRAGPPGSGSTTTNPNSLVKLDSVGTLRNDTPLADRFFLSYRHAFPIVLAPGERVSVLLRTNAYVGYHEFDLTLSSRRVFLENAVSDIVQEWMIIISSIIIGTISLLIGFSTPSPLMSTFGFMMIVIAVLMSTSYGYLSQLPYPESTSFKSITLSTNIRLLLDISVQLFIYQAIKPAVRDIRWYKPAMRFLIALCITGILLHILPYHYYGYVKKPVNRIMAGVSFTNLIWIGSFSLLAYRRAGIGYLGLFALLMVGDVVVKQLSELIMGSEISLLKFPPPNPPLIITLLTYLTASQFRRELVTKQRLQKQVYTTQQDMDTLRRREIERIGRDLHDQVGNTLASALGYIAGTQANADKPRELIRDAITELRFLSHNLVKDDTRPLTEKVETLVSRFNDFSPIQFIFQDHTRQMINGLPPLQQQSLYSILQELLTNAVRHSGARVAYVQFFCDEQTIDIAVEDDGVGFDMATAQRTGIGLQNMYKRAELAQITIRFDAVPTGTSVFLSIPRDEHIPNHSY